MNVGPAIRSILLADATLSATLKEVSPLVMGQKIQLPYCVYETNAAPANIYRTGNSLTDTINLDLTVFGKNYIEVHEILRQVRTVLDGFCGIVESTKILKCWYTESTDAFNAPALIYGHTISFTLKVKSAEYVPPVWLLEGGIWADAGEWVDSAQWQD